MTRLSVGLDVTPLYDHPTGVTRFVAGLLRALSADAGLDVHGWTLSARSIDHSRPSAAEAPSAITRIRIPARVVHRSWAAGLDIGSRRLRSFDVIHGTNFAAPPGPRSIVSLHDLTLFDQAGSTTRGPGRAGVIRRAVSSGSHLIVPTEHVRRLAVDILGADPERVTAVAYGLTPIPDATPGAGRSHTKMLRYILALGTVHRRKNLVRLIRAMDSLPTDIGLVIAGAAGDDEAAVSTALDDLGRRRPVRRLRDVDDATRAELLRDAVLLAYPSIDEGFGFPPLEAMSVGVPVVAGNAGSIPEVLGDAALLVDPLDTDSIAEALGRSMMPEVSADLVRRGLLTAGRYDWKIAAAETAAIYRRVAGQHGH